MSVPEINIGDLVEGARSESETWERALVRVDRVPWSEQQCHTILFSEDVAVSVKDSTLRVVATNEELTEAFECGREKGWDHANFVNAYGNEHERKGPDYPGSMALDPAEPGIPYSVSQARIREGDNRRARRVEFARGWSEGRRNFRLGRYPDGEKIEG